MSRLNLTPSQATPDTISFPALTGLAGTIGQPCFSPHTNRGKRFLGPNLICAVDGGTRPNYGSAPYRQLCPAYPFANHFATCLTSHAKAALVIGQKAAQERFSEEKFSEPYSTSLIVHHRKRISQQVYRKSPHNFCGTYGTQQAKDELAEPNNYSN